MEMEKQEKGSPLSEINQGEIDNKEKDIKVEVRVLIEQLDKLDRTYFGKDRYKQMKQRLDKSLELLDTKPLDLSKFPFFYILKTSKTYHLFFINF